MFLHTNLDIFDAGQNCTLVGPGHGSMVFGLSTKSYILSGSCCVLKNSSSQVTVGGNQWFLYHAWRWGQVSPLSP